MDLNRRQFIQSTAAFGALAGIPLPSFAATNDLVLKAQKTKKQILPAKYPQTEVWSYNSELPGPTIRLKQGDDFKALFQNELDVASSIHWHGLRLPNNMDGVPFITQKPVGPKEEFSYHFKAKDSGTFWYHPHLNSAEQVDRGLSGAFIVEEENPIEVEQDIVVMIDDFRLGEDGKIIDDFPNLHDRAHSGRIGNIIALNGQFQPLYKIEAGSRVRLRMINSSNARIYTPQLPRTQAWIVAFDGQPITPKVFRDDLLRLGPGMRADLIVDFERTVDLIDTTYRDDSITLARFEVSGKQKIRTEAPKELAPNPLGLPDLNNAARKTIIYDGGAMGGLESAKLNGRTDTPLRELARNHGVVWATNNNSYTSLEKLNKAERLYKLDHNKSYIFELVNQSGWIHPIHLHGHTFKVLSRNGQALKTPLWQDTVLLYPREKVEIAFVADNPGHWMFHCHILDHASAGMIAALEVS